MSKEIYISSTPHETRLAIVENDALTEIYYERENEYTLAGSIYNGKVTRVLPGMQSSFVDIGLERDAFLYITDFMEEAGDSADFDTNGDSSRRRNGSAPTIEGVIATSSGEATTDSASRSDRGDRGDRSGRGDRGRGRGRRDRGGNRTVSPSPTPPHLRTLRKLRTSAATTSTPLPNSPRTTPPSPAPAKPTSARAHPEPTAAAAGVAVVAVAAAVAQVSATSLSSPALSSPAPRLIHPPTNPQSTPTTTPSTLMARPLHHAPTPLPSPPPTRPQRQPRPHGKAPAATIATTAEIATIVVAAIATTATVAEATVAAAITATPAFLAASPLRLPSTA